MTSSDTEPKMANMGVCEPPPTANATAPTRGTTIAARTARRSASRSGSRWLLRSAARRHRPAGVSMHRMLPAGRAPSAVVGQRAEPPRIQCVEELVGDPLDVVGVPRRQHGLFDSDENVERPRREHPGLTCVLQDLECRFDEKVEALPVDGRLHRVHLGVDGTPHPDRALRTVRQREPLLDQQADATPRIRLFPNDVDDADRAVLPPMRDQCARVGRPAGEVVIEGAGRDAEPVAYLGEFQATISELRQYVEAGVEVRLPGYDARHGVTIVAACFGTPVVGNLRLRQIARHDRRYNWPSLAKVC